MLRLTPGKRLMLADHLYHLFANPPRRVEGGHGLLKNHRDLCAAPLAKLFLGRRQDIFAE